MAHSPLIGIDPAALEPAGRDVASLGPSDSTDSGADMAGLERLDDDDPSRPVDIALNEDDESRTLLSTDALDAAGDAGGTGERRSAGNDAGHEAADIGVDRIFTPGADLDVVADDPVLVDAGLAEAADPLDDDELDDDLGGDGPDAGPRARADAARDTAIDARRDRDAEAGEGGEDFAAYDEAVARDDLGDPSARDDDEDAASADDDRA